MSKCEYKPYDFSVFQGDDKSFSVAYQNPDGSPIDLTGYTARMQARASYDSDAAVLDLSVGDGLTITPLAGKISVALANAVTADIPAGVYVYDLEITSGAGVRKKLIFGKMTVLAEVTKI